mmetsp:Transcript_9233/g.26420  ORF Transcript_9233/g.26420 Transcript_9233/m.26420 type:complete len:280 (+) Transcript_9233:49-888(+)
MASGFLRPYSHLPRGTSPAAVYASTSSPRRCLSGGKSPSFRPPRAREASYRPHRCLSMSTSPCYPSYFSSRTKFRKTRAAPSRAQPFVELRRCFRTGEATVAVGPAVGRTAGRPWRGPLVWHSLIWRPWRGWPKAQSASAGGCHGLCRWQTRYQGLAKGPCLKSLFPSHNLAQPSWPATPPPLVPAESQSTRWAALQPRAQPPQVQGAAPPLPPSPPSPEADSPPPRSPSAVLPPACARNHAAPSWSAAAPRGWAPRSLTSPRSRFTCHRPLTATVTSR